MVTASGNLPPERRGINGSGLCHSKDVPQEREICWSPTVGKHEESPNIVVEFILSWGVGIGVHHLLQVWVKFYGNCVPYNGTLVWKVYARIKTPDGSN